MSNKCHYIFVIIFCFIFSVGSINSTEPDVDYVKFLTQYSSVIMRNLESHVNNTEIYLEENSIFVKFATSTLSTLTKSVNTLSRNVGLGEVPTQDFRNLLNNLSKQVKDVNSEQKRQREATHLLSMKIDLVLQTLISQKDRTEELTNHQDKQEQIFNNIELAQKESISAIEDLKIVLIQKLNAKDETVVLLNKEFDNFTYEMGKDNINVQKNIKHIKDITDENFMILRNHLKKQADCPKVNHQPKIYHRPEPSSTIKPILKSEDISPNGTKSDKNGGKSPKIESATTFINIDLLRDFEARIIVSGDPRPIVTWNSGSSCNGDPQTTITTGGRYTVGLSEMNQHSYAATLKISTFRHEDANLCYFITANNSAGTTSSTVIMAPRMQMQDCPGSYHKVGDECLDLITLWSPWDVSKSECEALGGSLIQHKNLEELFAILDTWPTIKTAEKNQKFWIGVRKSHTNDWRLVNGTEFAVNETLWATNEPNESGDCLMVDIGEDKWRVWDAPCTSQRQAICQML